MTEPTRGKLWEIRIGLPPPPPPPRESCGAGVFGQRFGKVTEDAVPPPPIEMNSSHTCK